MNFKAAAIFFTVYTLLLTSVNGQLSLADADSLFENGKYTEAFETYDSLLQMGNASPQMLLKMAFIQEGLQDFTSALYYLSVYYELSGDKKVLGKMTEIASTHQLIGYEFDDIDFIANLYEQYRLYFVIGLLLFSLAMFAVLVYHLRQGQSVVVPAILQILIITGLFLATNKIFAKQVAIVASDHTILRSAPSAAAEPIEMISKGHRVEVLSEDEVWIKIEWLDREAYLRRGRVKLI